MLLVRRLVLASLALPMLLAADDPTPSAFAGIPNLTVEYYGVSGRSVDAIRKAMNAARPNDPNDGTPVDSVAHWEMAWGWRGGAGGCDLTSVQVSFSGIIKLPRLADETKVPARVLARWRAYRAALEKHEEGHVRYAYDHMGDVAKAMRGATCATLNDVGKAAVAEIARHDVAYDRETRHGASQGAIFP